MPAAMSLATPSPAIARSNVLSSIPSAILSGVRCRGRLRASSGNPFSRTIFAAIVVRCTRDGRIRDADHGPSAPGRNWRRGRLRYRGMCPSTIDVWRSRRWRADFFPINISALSPTLVESELFGHRRGAFTGAIADVRGRLETCPELGSVFLDELGIWIRDSGEAAAGD